MAEKQKQKQYKLKEVCIRLAEGHPLYSDQPLSTPGAALDVMRREMSQYDREVLCVVNMNARLQPINFNVVSVGDINASIAAIPNILKSGLMSNASSFMLLHNHPSGDVTPSQDDITTTRKVIEAGKIMGIPCVRCNSFPGRHHDHQEGDRSRQDHGDPLCGPHRDRRRERTLL